MVVDLFVKERPNTCKNFLKLCKIKYYNFNQFFTIEQNYIAQSGDPSNSGRGGESIYGILYGDQARYFEKESIPKLKHTRKGLLSMVNNGSNMLGSQFFVTLDDNLDYLDDMHCIFAKSLKPYRDIRICHTILLHDPFDDPLRLPIPARSPSRPLNNTKIAVDESVEDEELDTEENGGDLHHADERPPDNVLFVCKLNPVTADEDLEIIFSRFGQINCCEVIKDKRTQASLQYAFIEFDKPEYCEAAFLKMDNVLIDDRRIHVDFSQSVAKNFQWNKGGKQAAEPAKKWKTESRSSHPPQSLPKYPRRNVPEQRREPRKQRSRSPVPRKQRSRSPVPRKQRSRSPLPRREKKRRSSSSSASPSPQKRHKERKHKSKDTRHRSRSRSPASKKAKKHSAIINFVLIYC
uniref:Peptidyl-prolyl cis-trans isomerase n=1 Tax=Ditylenchus dipsaci TaxID=166011 RepID=A0A915E9H7_9BILA